MFYHYTIFPLENFLSIILSLLHGVTGSYLLALILLSVVVRIITTPLEKLADKSVMKEHDISSVLSPQIAQIKTELKGGERHEAIKRLYGRYGYHPIYAVRSMFALLVQLPFFLAAYYLIGESTALQGVIVPLIGDLGQPDSLLFGAINFLPFVMTGVNLAALFTTPDFDKKESIQGLCIALLFLVLLYNSPAALLIYWTVNQAGSLAKNILGKFVLKPIIPQQIIVNISIAFLFSIASFSSLLFFKPFSIYLTNSLDFSSLNTEIASELCVNLFLVVTLSTLFVAITLSFIKKYRLYFIVLCIALTIGFFIQGNILQWNYGLLDGKNVPWAKFWYRGIIDLVVWVVIIGLCFKYREFLQRKITSIFYAIIIFQALIFMIEQHEVLFTPTTIAETQKVNSVRYAPDSSQQFVFSKEKNIIVLVFDGYRGRLFEEVLAEMPELVKELDGFTRFTDMLGVGGYTFFSTATYLGTGKPFLNRQTHSQYLQDNFSGKETFFRRMVADKWTTGIYNKVVFSFFQKNPFTPSMLTEITKSGSNKVQQTGDIEKIIKASIFSSSPQLLKRFLFSALDIQNIWNYKIDYSSSDKADVSFALSLLPDIGPDLQFFNALQKGFKLRDKGAAFKYFHIPGLHSPLPLIDRNFNKITKTSQIEIGLVDAKLMLRLIRMFKSTKIYNNSQIYIMADHGQYSITSAVEKAENLIKYSYPKDSQPLFLFKDFSATGDLQKNGAQLSFLDLPQIIYELSKKTKEKEASSIIDKYTRKTRLFYTFSNMNGEYYPTIIEARITGDSHEPANWSLSGNTFSAVKNIKPLSDNACIHFTQYKEYGGYVINGIIGGGTKTRGNVDFALPLAKALANSDIKITIEIAARADEKTTYRDYKILTGNAAIFKGRLVAPDYTSISFGIPVSLIKDSTAKFTLKPLNPSHGKDKETGKKMWSEAFKIKKLTVQKTVLSMNQKSDIMYDIKLGKLRLKQLRKLKNALGKYFSKNGHYPRSVGYDGIKTKWGKASKNWIPGLAPEFIGELPKDPRMSDDENVQYLYKSDGKDYKLLAHGIAPLTKAELQLQDPKRSTWAFGYWTAGALNW